MKWFKFLINFALFFAAVVFVTFGFGYLTGYIYFAQTNGQVTAEAVYETFGGLRVVDIIYGVLLLAISGFGIFTRFRLAQYKSDGPVCLYIYYGVNAVLTLLYNIAVGAVTGLNTFSADGTVSLITSVVIIVLNVAYFNKRKELFVN